MESHGDRFDEVTGSRVRSAGTDLTLAIERDLIPGVAVATLNLGYQPEWTHFAGALTEEQESGVTFGVIMQGQASVSVRGRPARINSRW